MKRPSLIAEKFSLREINSWKVGGTADYFCQPETTEELIQACKWAHENKLPVTTYSSGSNVLISDEGIRGLTVNMKKFVGLEDQSDAQNIRLTVMSGTSKAELLKIFLREKVSPALFLTGLPGDIGGGVVMNAGVSTDISPKEFGEIVEWVEVLTPAPELKLKKMKHDDIKWTYRHTHGWQPGIITRTGILWPKKTDETISDQAKQLTRRRLQTQPLDKPSGGSTFRNPTGHKAGQLIEGAGLKGFRIGGAEVSSKHANFIVTDKDAAALDVHLVIQYVRNTVKEKSGVELQPEVVYLGEWPHNI